VAIRRRPGHLLQEIHRPFDPGRMQRSNRFVSGPSASKTMKATDRGDNLGISAGRHNVDVSERWIVDAMNVIGSRPDGWWKDRDEAMRAFAVAVDDHAASTGRDITVVFDSDPGALPEPTNIEIVIAAQGGRNAADHEIERLVGKVEDRASLRVVTSDRALGDSVAAAGADVISAGTFRRELDRGQ